MLYKAIVKHKETKEFTIIESESKSKKQFINDLRGNGYMVNINKVKRAELFDWIINNTNCQPMDWKLKDIPNDEY